MRIGVIWDRLVLWLCCLAAMCSSEINTKCIIGMLVAVTASTMAMYFDKRAVKTALVVVYAFLCAAFGEFLWMMPVAAYELCYQREWLWLFVYLLPAILYPEHMGIQTALFLLAVWLAYKTREAERLEAGYHSLQDKHLELKIRMDRGQKEMALRQDGELRLATLTERNRIAREIHDNVGHLLSRSILQAGAIRTINRQENLAEPLGALAETLDTAMDSIRESVHGLKDEAFDLEGMVRGLESEYPGIAVRLDYDMSEGVPRNLKYCFAAIIREALTNTVRHSNATKAAVVLREHPALYQLLIEDNGTKKKEEISNNGSARGKTDARISGKNNPGTMNRRRSSGVENSNADTAGGRWNEAGQRSDLNGCGMGLEGMRERVESFHGRIAIDRENGYRIFVTIPKAVQEDGRDG